MPYRDYGIFKRKTTRKFLNYPRGFLIRVELNFAFSAKILL